MNHFPGVLKKKLYLVFFFTFLLSYFFFHLSAVLAVARQAYRKESIEKMSSLCSLRSQLLLLLLDHFIATW